MAPSSRARRAKQTQLTFTPLPSSSPASQKMEQDHGTRKYAAVGLEGGGKRKRGRIDEVEEDAEGEFARFLVVPGRRSTTGHKAMYDFLDGARDYQVFHSKDRTLRTSSACGYHQSSCCQRFRPFCFALEGVCYGTSFNGFPIVFKHNRQPDIYLVYPSIILFIY